MRGTSWAPTVSSPATRPTIIATRAARIVPAISRCRARTRWTATSAISAVISAACSTMRSTSAILASAQCGSRRSSTTPMKPSPAASRSAAPAR
ncbi:hypothetical protein G6F45_014278 [Rhizopus arrhizus]|nr:hypothetical protein G6F45_014278 [Rhizopus arrhizus]